MRMSPRSRSGTRVFSVGSTTAAGTISQTARGCFSFATNSSSDVAPTAPSLTRGPPPPGGRRKRRIRARRAEGVAPCWSPSVQVRSCPIPCAYPVFRNRSDHCSQTGAANPSSRVLLIFERPQFGETAPMALSATEPGGEKGLDQLQGERGTDHVSRQDKRHSCRRLRRPDGRRTRHRSARRAPPATLFAATEAPTPLPQSATPRSTSPAATALVKGMMNSG